MAESNPTELITTEGEAKVQSTVTLTPSLALLDPDFGTELVTIYVGPENKAFVVYKKPICESADFFKAAFTTGYQETKNELDMREDDAGAFALYVNWVYRSTIAFGHTESHLHSLYHLYLLAEKLGLVHLKDEVMDSIQDMAQKFDLKEELFTRELLQDVQTKTGRWAASKLRGLGDFCIQMMVFTHRMNYNNGASTEGPPTISTTTEPTEPDIPFTQVADLKFVWEVSQGNFEFFQAYQNQFARLCQQSREFLGDPRERDEYTSDRCYYHCHDEGMDCRAVPEKPKVAFVHMY